MDKRNFIIGTLVLLLGITFYFGFLNYREVFKIDNKGYLFSSKDIVDKLNTPDLTESDSVVEYHLSNENEKVYKKGFKYYIGEEKKYEINLNLPSISEDGSRVTNLSNTGYLITKEFQVYPSFDNSVLTNGALYNGVSLDRVDNEEYIMIKTDTNIFINSPKLIIDIQGEEVEIQENSILNFIENEVRYYYLDNGVFKYKRIGGISLDDKVKYFDQTILYKDFLVNLEVIGNLEFEEEVLPDIKEEIKPPLKRPDPVIEDTEEEYVYIKPAVSGSIVSSSTYSMKANIEIEDPARRIETSPTIEVKLGNRIYVKKVFYSNGEFDIIGLLPDTEFDVIGYYTYRDESEKLMKYTFINTKIRTKDLSNVENIKLLYDNNKIFPDKVEFTNMALKNESTDEVLKGIKRVEVQIDDNIYNLSNKSVGLLKSLKETEYKSPTSLESNRTYNVKFLFYDVADNLLVVENSETRVKTSKQIPTVDIEVTDTDLTYFKAEITFENNDDVYMDNVRYVLTDNKNNIIVNEKLLSNKISVEDLDVNQMYNLTIFGDYDIEDGNGILKDVKLRTVKISTKPISTLGFVRLNLEEKSILQNDANYSLSINMPSTDEKLVELLTELYITITNKETKEVVYVDNIKGDDITSLKSNINYNLVIENLTSKTEYSIEANAIVKQGSKEFSIKGLTNIKEFMTLKQEAIVEITNKYTSENLIDFDVRIQDTDGAILSNRAILEIRDSSGTLIGFKHFDINSEYVRLTYDKLTRDEDYTFKYYAEEYNVGYNNATYIQDKELKKEVINTSRGIHGEIYLESLLKEITSKNIFDISNNTRWKKDGSSTIDQRTLDETNNIIKMSSRNGYATYAYYLPEAKNEGVDISFKVRHTSTSNMQSVYLSNGGGSNRQYELTGLSEEWKEFKFNIGLNPNQYIGFYINEIGSNNTVTTIEVKDLIISKQSYNLRPGINESIYDVKYIFKNTVMFRGDEEMPTTTGDTMPYNTMSNGSAKITNTETNTVYNFNYINAEETFVVPSDGNYKVELWGAAGGGGGFTVGSRAGRGGYSAGTIQLKEGTPLYINVGGVGKYGGGSNPFGGPLGGYNGGGYGGNGGSGSGGGATDIRLVPKTSNELESLKSRIIVAGGGGGSDDIGGSKGGSNDGSGGDGGGITSGGAVIDGALYNSYAAYQAPINGSQFGYGENVSISTDTGGGGGGYYGGTATNNNNGGAGGGSSYISGHLGCINYNKLTLNNDEEVDIKYSEKDTYKATLYASLNDTKDELVDKEFYVQLIRDGVVENIYPYDMNDQTSIENVLLEYSIKKNTEYEIRLAVKIRDRFYPVDTAYFTTEEEIRSIKTEDEFFKMHISGKYLVLNSLDFRNMYNHITSWFSGKIDFQGNDIYMDVDGTPNELFTYVKNEALFENMNVHFYLNNPVARSNYYGLFYDFRGTVRNLKITVEESTDVPNTIMSLIAYVNRGTIENFVINNKAGFSASRFSALGFVHNYGVMKNGYLYGKEINASFPTPYPLESKRIGAVAGYASSNSRIENVFSLVPIKGVDPNTTENPTIDDRIGSIIGEASRTKLINVYSYTSGDNRTLTRDANVGNHGYVSAKNLFYISDEIYNPLHSLKVPKSVLRDTDFHENLNGDKKFLIDEYVKYGFFPQIDWPDSMPNQEFIELPDVDDADLVDIISVKETKNEANEAFVTLLVNNPSSDEITNIGIKDISTVEILEQLDIPGGKSEVKIKLSNPIRYLSKYYLKSITSRNNFGRDYTRDYEDNERSLLIDMYRSVNSIEEFGTIKTYPTENFILTTDLDFANTPSSFFQINNLSGILNGDNHTIKNMQIPTNQGFINELRGTLKNLNVEKVVRAESSPHDRFGLVGYLYFGATVDNVHVKDILLYSYNRMGGLVAYSSGGIIRNSSVTNPRIGDVSTAVDITVGGLVGEMHETSIDNCYVQGVEFDLTKAKTTNAVGGLAGYTGSGSISNAYSTGTIESKFENTGGLVGLNNVTIQNVYSNVTLSSKADYLGGIVGRSRNDAISNSLFVGSVYSYLIDSNIKRIAGDRTIINNNYAWNNQHVNGKISGVTNGETLITSEDLANRLTYEELIKMSENFNYDDLENRKLPKLMNAECTEVLPHQEDNYLKVYDFEVVNILTKKAVADAYIQLEIDNPEHYELKNFKVDGMNIEMKKNVNLGTSTYIEFLGTPDKAFDSYKLYEFTYVKDGEEKEFKTDVKIDAKFYKDIEKFEDWQKISKTDAENYRLIADIDFAGKSNINYNVTFNRLEGTGDTKKVLKNIDLNISGGDSALIKSVYSTMTNVAFENVTITNTNYVERNGLLLYAFGRIGNLSFKDIKINTPSASFASIISFDRTYDLRDIDLNNIYVRGRYMTSGFIAKSNVSAITNITFDGLDILGTGTYTAGIIAHSDYVSSTRVFNITGTNGRIEGYGSYVGGVYGYSGGQNNVVDHMEVIGRATYTGGIAGHFSAYNPYHNNISDSTVTSSGNHIGGINGAGYLVYYSFVDNVEIRGTSTGSYNVGGITGAGGYNTSHSAIRNSKVISAGDYVGGIRGNLSWSTIEDCYVLDTIIEARKYAGGISGAAGNSSSASTIRYTTNNATIKATEMGAGGLIGYAENANTNETSNRIFASSNIVANATVTSPLLSGAFVGRADKSFFPGHITANVVSANVFNTNTESKNAIVGSSDYYTSSAGEIRIYDNTTLNGIKINTESGLTDAMLVTGGQLAESATYTSIGFSTYYFNFSKLSSGFYPYQGRIISSEHHYFPLPLAPSSSFLATRYMMARMSMNPQFFHLLPEYKIYASDVDKINVEFYDLDLVTNMTVNGIKTPIDKKVFTYYYNFKNDIEITIDDGVNKETKKFSASDLANTIYTNKDKYYIIKNKKLISNDKDIKGNAINIINNKVLLDNGKVIDLSTHEIKYMVYNDFKELDHAKELYNFDFNGLSINTFYNYSFVEGNEMDHQLFVKNNRIEMLQGGSNSKLESIIIDNYNDKNFLTVLSSDGYIYNLKDKIVFPDKFDNFKIKRMSNNLTNNSNLVAVEYENNDFIVFDYRNGEVYYKNYKSNSNIFEYFKETFTAKSIANEETKKLSSYKETQNLINTIVKDNIIDEDTGGVYIPVYKASKNKYDIYDITSLTNKNVDAIKDINNSVTDEINNNVTYKDHYIDNKVEQKKETNSIVIFLIILVGIILSILLLGNNIKFKKGRA